MVSVQFPPPQFRMKKRGGEPYIFDAIRKRWLLLTGEEWVRQNMVAYLTTTLGYPAANLALEKTIRVNDLKKRFDILLYDTSHRPFLMVECKAPEIPLNDTVLQQALRYHLALPVQWIVLTNGEATIAWLKTTAGLEMKTMLPRWPGVANPS